MGSTPGAVKRSYIAGWTSGRATSRQNNIAASTKISCNRDNILPVHMNKKYVVKIDIIIIYYDNITIYYYISDIVIIIYYYYTFLLPFLLLRA
jgi:hypothetical protein